MKRYIIMVSFTLVLLLLFYWKFHVFKYKAGNEINETTTSVSVQSNSPTYNFDKEFSYETSSNNYFTGYPQISEENVTLTTNNFSERNNEIIVSVPKEDLSNHSGYPSEITYISTNKEINTVLSTEDISSLIPEKVLQTEVVTVAERLSPLTNTIKKYTTKTITTTIKTTVPKTNQESEKHLTENKSTLLPVTEDMNNVTQLITVQNSQELIINFTDIATENVYQNVTSTWTNNQEEPSETTIEGTKHSNSIPEEVSILNEATIQLTSTTLNNEPSLLIAILSKSQWYPNYPNFDCKVTLAEKIKKVLIRQTGENCFDEENCVNALKKLMRTDHNRKLQDINYNYIIGGDGIVYEARGRKCRVDGSHKFYTPDIDEMHIGVTGDVKNDYNYITDNQKEILKKFLFECSQNGKLNILVDKYVLQSYHDTSDNCSCPIEKSALYQTCAPCVLNQKYYV